MFKNIFKSNTEHKKTETTIHWVALTDVHQLETLKKESATTTVIIFKHSTRCSVSRMALKQFENNFDKAPNTYVAYFLDLLSYRDVSNEIATQFQVYHQSPQLLVLNNGVVVKHASHYDIGGLEF